MPFVDNLAIKRVHPHRRTKCNWQSGRYPGNGDTCLENQKSGQYPDFPAIGIIRGSRYKLARA